MADDHVDQDTGWFGFWKLPLVVVWKESLSRNGLEVLTVLIGRLRREVTGKGQEPRTPLIWGSTAPKSLPPFLGRSALCQDCTANGDRLESDGDTSVGYLRRGWRQMWA